MSSLRSLARTTCRSPSGLKVLRLLHGYLLVFDLRRPQWNGFAPMHRTAAQQQWEWHGTNLGEHQLTVGQVWPSLLTNESAHSRFAVMLCPWSLRDQLSRHEMLTARLMAPKSTCHTFHEVWNCILFPRPLKSLNWPWFPFPGNCLDRARRDMTLTNLQIPSFMMKDFSVMRGTGRELYQLVLHNQFGALEARKTSILMVRWFAIYARFDDRGTGVPTWLSQTWTMRSQRTVAYGEQVSITFTLSFRKFYDSSLS